LCKSQPLFAQLVRFYSPAPGGFVQLEFGLGNRFHASETICSFAKLQAVLRLLGRSTFA